MRFLRRLLRRPLRRPVESTGVSYAPRADGRPDPGASVDYCKETGYVPPERQDFRKTESPNFQQSGSLPTELESKKVDEGAAKPATTAPAAAPAPAASEGSGGKK